MLSPTRDAEAAERSFRQMLRASHTRTPPGHYGRQARRIPTGFRGPPAKRSTARDLPSQARTIQGYEALPRLRKGQLEGLTKRDVLAQNRLINQLFGLAA